MSSSIHIDNRGKYILILGKGPKQRLDGTTFTAEALNAINITQSRKRFVLRFLKDFYIIMKATVFCLLMLQKYINSKQKNSEIKDYTLCLGNALKDFTINNREKPELKGTVKLFSVDFNSIDTNNVTDIHKYLMERT